MSAARASGACDRRDDPETEGFAGAEWFGIIRRRTRQRRIALVFRAAPDRRAGVSRQIA